jgi:hypothetical protein
VNELTYDEVIQNLKEASNAWQKDYAFTTLPNGVNIVSDNDEDYVVDALFDIPNR